MGFFKKDIKPGIIFLALIAVLNICYGIFLIYLNYFELKDLQILISGIVCIGAGMFFLKKIKRLNSDY